jgi:hypothetical protein
MVVLLVNPRQIKLVKSPKKIVDGAATVLGKISGEIKERIGEKWSKSN